ncbi:MAG TPA: FG-GAP-like repeat-containing protein, partial [Lamprocystis sp. (in: g-proteobacteria)]|nr:FG-GAP-like repeat-containing protein [Lamprocystis sp. (in: g-proteobacteria)]
SVRYSLTANLTPPPVRGPGLAFGESAAGDRIGAAVAVAGDTLAVGAPGIEGRGAVYRPGLVHLFRHYAGSWTKEQEIAPADGAVGDFFGAAVALAGDTLVVGAPRVDAVYVFVRGVQGWVQQARIRGADAGAGAYSDFGAAVALSAAGTGSAAAPVLVIGAPYDGAPCDSGAAYVYRRRGDTWQREARLTAADPGCWDHFGQAVAVADTTVAVGAPGDDFDAPKRWEVGSVYLFQRKGGAWRPATKLFNAEGWAEFGRAVALSGPTLLVGAPRADGQGWDSEAGKAFVYSGAGDAWGLKQVLIPVDRQNGDRFGAALALTQDAAIVGSPTALGGRGAAYEFKPAGGSWQEAAKFTVGEGAGPGVGPGLGGSVATAGDTYAVGAPTASNQETTYPGAAFVFAGSRRADLVLDLGPKGLWRRLGDTTWSRLSSATAVSMVAGDLDGNGVSDLVIDRGSVGLSLALNGAPDRVLDARSARQLAVGDLDGDGRADLVADFGPDGISVWKNGSGWQALPAPVAAPATNLAVGDLDGDGHADLVADYGAGGLWARINETAWAKLHPAATEGLLIADIDGDGLGNLIANRGADEGVWVSRDHQWERLHSAAPRHMAAGDFDGNGRIDLAFDLGGEGIWLRRNDADWTRVYDGTADLMMTADLDGNGQSDLLLALDTAGTEVWMNNRTWQHLHDSPARFAVAGNFAR